MNNAHDNVACAFTCLPRCEHGIHEIVDVVPGYGKNRHASTHAQDASEWFRAAGQETSRQIFTGEKKHGG